MKLHVTAAWLVLASWVHAGQPSWIERFAFRVRPELRRSSERLAALDTELATLPKPVGVRSGNRIGFESGRDAEENDLWVEIAFPAPVLADSIVMVPTVVKGATGTVPGFGFPQRFTLEAFDENGGAHVLLDKTSEDYPNPGIYPVAAHFAPMTIRRVRFTAVTPWHSEGPSVLSLSEMLVLKGNRNVALGGKVNAGSSRDAGPTWARSNLADMNMPLGLPIAPLHPPSPRLGYHSATATEPYARKSVTVEFPAIVTVDEIRLVPVRRSELPSWVAYGFPVRFLVETALQPDFSDARIIWNQTDRPMPSPGQNLVCLQAGGVSARYVRVTATQLWERSGDYVLALAELQAYEGDKNVALGAKVTATDSIESSEWGASALTDNLANGGRLIELPEWFRMLEHRRELEGEREALLTRRAALLERTEAILFKASVGGTCAVAALAAFQFFGHRRRRRRERDQLRERLARDLHDEIGSNLGSIALLSAVAAQPATTEETMRSDLVEIERVARESADSMHDMVALLGGKRGASGDWLVVLSSLAERLLRGVELERALPAAPLAIEPDLETRRELYLFCKEVLHNAAKHGHPTHVRFEIAPTPTGLRVEIADNGCGFDPAAPASGFGLNNLRTRAATMKAHLEIQSTPDSGTVVRLDLPRTRRWRTR